MRWNEYQTKTDPVSSTDELLIKDETDNVKRMPAISFKWDKGDKGDKWDKGDQWIQWETWPVWPQWPQGEQGIPWPAIDPKDIKREVENVLDKDETITKQGNDFNWNDQLVKTWPNGKIPANTIPWWLPIDTTELVDNTMYCFWWEEIIKMQEFVWTASMSATADSNINIWTTQPMFVDFCEIDTYSTSVTDSVVLNCYSTTWWTSLVWSSVKTEIIETNEPSPTAWVNWKKVRFYFNFWFMALNTVKYVRPSVTIASCRYASIPANTLKGNRFLNWSNSANTKMFLSRLCLKKVLTNFQANWSTSVSTFYKYYPLNTKKPGELFYYKDWVLQSDTTFSTSDVNAIKWKYVMTDNHWLVSYSDVLTTTTFWYCPENGVIQPFYATNPLFEYSPANTENTTETKELLEYNWMFTVVWPNNQVWDFVFKNLQQRIWYNYSSSSIKYDLAVDKEIVQKFYFVWWKITTIGLILKSPTSWTSWTFYLYDSNFNVKYNTSLLIQGSWTYTLNLNLSAWYYYVWIKSTSWTIPVWLYNTWYKNSAGIRSWTTVTPIEPVSWYDKLNLVINTEQTANLYINYNAEAVFVQWSYVWVISEILNWKCKIAYSWVLNVSSNSYYSDFNNLDLLYIYFYSQYTRIVKNVTSSGYATNWIWTYVEWKLILDFYYIT